MFTTNYAQLIDSYPQYLRLPIYITEDITIDGVVMPANSWLSTDKPEVLMELGYKPVTRTEMPVTEGYYYTETWTDTGEEIVQGWEAHEMPEDPLIDAVTALETLGYKEVDNG